jgi:hypothetical protein
LHEEQFFPPPLLQVHINVKPGKQMEHHGVKIEFIGAVGKCSERNMEVTACLCAERLH